MWNAFQNERNPLLDVKCNTNVSALLKYDLFLIIKTLSRNIIKVRDSRQILLYSRQKSPIKLIIQSVS